MTTQKNRRIVNYLLLLAGAITSLSGILIQINYHFGNPNNITKTTLSIWGFGYANWCIIHKIAIVFFMILCIYHIYIHRKWYQAVLAKRLLRKKNRQVLIFSGLFFLSAITGIIPWVIDSFKTDQFIRILFIEIHDKISLILVVFILLHIIKRAKRLA